MNVFVGIEITRALRIADGKLQGAGELAVGGVNLLEHQVKVALQLTPADNVCLLTPQGDEKLLEIASRHEVREISPYDFISMLADRAKHGEDGAVILLRQIAPLRNAEPVKAALKLLKKHPVLISHSKVSGREDTRCLAFEIRRVSEFSKQAMAALNADEEQAWIDAADFAELTRTQDETGVVAKVKSWYERYA